MQVQRTNEVPRQDVGPLEPGRRAIMIYNPRLVAGLGRLNVVKLSLNMIRSPASCACHP